MLSENFKSGIKKSVGILIPIFFVVYFIFYHSEGAKGLVTIFSDSFTGTTIDTNKWTETDAAGGGGGGGAGNVQQNNTLNITGSDAWGGNGLVSTSTFDRTFQDITIDVDVTSTNCGVNSVGLGYGDFNITSNPGDSYIVVNNSGITLYYFHNGVAVKALNTGFTCTNNVGFHLKLVILQAGGAALYINGTTTPNTSTDQGTFTSESVYMQSFSSSATVSYDNFAVTAPALPTAPTSLSGTPGNQQVTLSWSPPTDNGGYAISDYTIEYRSSTLADYTTFDDGISTATGTTVTGLTNLVTYQFRVSAVNANGAGTSSIIYIMPGILAFSDDFASTTIASKWTESDSAALGGTVGNVRQNGSLTVVGNDSWGANGVQSTSTFDRTNNDIYIQVTITGSACGTGGGDNAFGYGDMLFATSGTSYIVVQNGATWNLYYWLNGVNTAQTAITGFSCTTNQPFSMMLKVKQAGGASVFVNGSSTASATVSGGTFTNETIWLQHQAAGSTSTFDNVYVITPIIAPSAPSGVATTTGDGQVGLSWTAPNDNGSSITDYVIEYRSSTGSFVTFSDGVTTTTSTTVTGLTNGLSYGFRVSAVNAAGTSSASSIVSSTPISATVTAPYAASVSISGTAAVSEVLTGSYVFIDPNGDAEGSSTFRWLSADSASGPYSAISGATSTTYTVTSTYLGKYLKFEVTPISVVAPTTGSAVSSTATSEVGAALSYLNHILSTGQSLSVGYNGSPALTITQPFSNKMLTSTSLTPLIESGVETISSAMGNFITSNTAGNNYQVEVTRHGLSGTAYTGLKQGTTPYNNGLNQVTTSLAAATASGTPYRVIAVTTIHGESDHLAGTTAAQYEANLVEWQNNYNTDVKALTGQASDIPLFTDQMSSHTGYNSATSAIPISQLSAAENNQGDIILVGPKYFLNYSDTAHLTNASYRWLGEYYGKVIKKVVVDQQTWRPLSPRQIFRSGANIYAQFYVPVTPILIDTSTVLEKTNYGFEYSDSSSSASISSVEIFNSSTIKVTLNATPTGSNQRLRYAYTGTAGSNPGAQESGSARGNLRDSDTTLSQYGNTLYNWSVHFDKTMTADSTAPTVSGVTSTYSTSTATISWTTDEGGSSQINYGFATSTYIASTTEFDDSYDVSSHSVSLSGLVPCTVYHYRTRSNDFAQNEGLSSDSTFTTTGCTGSATVTSQAQSSISTSTGGAVSLTIGDANLSLTIPAGFSTSTATFQIKQIDKTSVIASTSNPSGYTAVGNHVYQLDSLSGVTTTITSFAQAITVVITYSADEVASFNESSLKIYRWNGSSWNELSNCSVNTTNRTVSCQTSNFSTFVLFGQPPATTPAPGGSAIPVSVGSSQTTALSPAAISTTTQTGVTGSVAASSSVVIKVPSTQFIFERFLYLGSIGADVRQLQTILKNMGYFTYSKITGYFGSVTKTAVVAFQKAQGLRPYPGWVGPSTRAVLNSVGYLGNNASTAVDKTSTAIFVHTLGFGSKGEEVRQLQIKLKELGYYTHPDITGFFGPATKAAVIALQKDYRLAPYPGWVGPETRAVLNGVAR